VLPGTRTIALTVDGQHLIDQLIVQTRRSECHLLM
jgi:hypothetical protein